MLDAEEVTVAKPFAKPFRVTGVFNHTRKQVLVVPFVFLSMSMTITVDEDNQALLVNFWR